MITADGEDVYWPYSRAPYTTLTAAQLDELRPKPRRLDTYKRCIAFAKITNGQLASLFADSGYNAARAYRKIGERIIQYQLEAYCENVSFDHLRIALVSRQKKGSKVDRKLLIERLLAFS